MNKRAWSRVLGFVTGSLTFIAADGAAEMAMVEDDAPAEAAAEAPEPPPALAEEPTAAGLRLASSP